MCALGDKNASVMRWQKRKWSNIPKLISRGVLWPYFWHSCATVWEMLYRIHQMEKLFSILDPESSLVDDTTNRIQDVANFCAGTVHSWTVVEWISFFLCYVWQIGNKAQHHRSCSFIPYLKQCGKGIYQLQHFFWYCIYKTLPISSANAQFQPSEVD